MIRIVFSAMALALAGSFILGCAQKRTVTIPQKIVVRDQSGRERASLIIGDNEARFAIHNAAGRTLFEFNFSEAGLHVEVVDEEGQTHGATITAEPSSSHN